MKEFRRPSGQGAGRGGFDKREQRPPSSGYGTHRGDRNAGEYNGGERREVKFQATCSECNKTCEVPFRPNGSKPVYCKDCFGAKKGAHTHNTRDERPAHVPQQAPQRDSRIDELKSQVDSMQSKLDRILRTLEGNKTVMPKPVAPTTPAKKIVKAVKKAAPMKKATSKPAAKPVAKKKK